MKSYFFPKIAIIMHLMGAGAAFARGDLAMGLLSLIAAGWATLYIAEAAAKQPV